MGDHHELVGWQKGIKLVVAVYKATDDFPVKELYGLTSEIRRAAVSIPANIAEGQGRRTDGEFCQFPGNARGSVAEVGTHIVVAQELGFLSKEVANMLTEQTSEVGRIISGLMESLEHLHSKRAAAARTNV